MTMGFSSGDRITNRAKPEWGDGEVLHADGGIALVRFANGAVRKLSERFLDLALPAKGAIPSAETAVPDLGQAGPDAQAMDSGGLVAQALAMLREMSGEGSTACHGNVGTAAPHSSRQSPRTKQ